ncbi:hypothetical protein B0H65DRAFT_424913 [Neurospora tetraspora]|uniref:Oxysterol-binding protein n=1 Tax=Neurospora tetraspora TaxID=94610 RepID=A0AAE0JID7_9PEZI|nr:hypothetical protein B0H65DRAFT_424913 [Neurospora tetraspora]
MDHKSVASRVRDLAKFLATVQGDLSNITGPPHLLAPSSVVEVGHCWAQRPSVFAAPSLESDPEKRMLLVLRWFLVALRSQLYIGSTGSKNSSIRKPLNAFLGELFLASWTDAEKKCTTTLVSEQVSHHPPITAMHVADAEHGIRTTGYARVEMSFNGTVNIRQVGNAVLHIDRFDEDYLMPLLDAKVRGILSGCMYPEVLGTYSIIGSSGYQAEIRFTGEGMIRGKRNSFEARIFHRDDPSQQTLYEVKGCWSEGGWKVRDPRMGETVEVYDIDAPENQPVPMVIDPLAEQDPWESRRAWEGVFRGMAEGDMRMVLNEKTRVEQAQRRMRAEEKERGIVWEPLFFKSVQPEEHEVFHRLAEGTGLKLHSERTKGVWKPDLERIESAQRPFRQGVTPLGYSS